MDHAIQGGQHRPQEFIEALGPDVSGNPHRLPEKICWIFIGPGAPGVKIEGNVLVLTLEPRRGLSQNGMMFDAGKIKALLAAK